MYLLHSVCAGWVDIIRAFYYRYYRVGISVVMSFLFKINGVEQEKTVRIMSILNAVQAAASWFPFIACIMLGNIKAQLDYTDVAKQTYNPDLALFAIIGILQACFGTLVVLLLMGKLPFMAARKPLVLRVAHWGFLVQFAFVSFMCLQASTEATIFAAINQGRLSNSSSNESFVVYSRYLSGWAVLEFLICLPISIANLAALHTRHINYDAITQEEDTPVHPQLQMNQFQQPTLPANSMMGGQVEGGAAGGWSAPHGDPRTNLQSSRPLQAQMLGK